MRTKISKLILFALLVAVLLSSCTVQLCVKRFGEDTVKFYTEQGKGNLSEGIRQYWRGLTKRAPDEGGRAEKI